MRTNTKTTGNDHRFDRNPAAALPGGMAPAKQNAFALLCRATCACLLWEDMAYQSGADNANNIAALVPQCDPVAVAKLAIELRTKQGLRHVPLYLMRELVRIPAARQIVGTYLPEVIQRADEISEFLALYWRGEDAGSPIASQVKKGLAAAFAKFDAYQLAKWQGEGKDISLRDAMFLTHPKPKTFTPGNKRNKAWRQERAKKHDTFLITDHETLFKQLAENKLPIPNTREVMLSAATTEEAKRDGFVRMLTDNKLGAMALLKNLKLMTGVGVPLTLIETAMANAKADKILPLEFMSAFVYAPQFKYALNRLMDKCLSRYTRLPGRSVFVIDVSGSMRAQVSQKSTFSRVHAALGMAMMASKVCEEVDIYLTAGTNKGHITKKYTGPRNLDMMAEAQKLISSCGGGGIFTRQCLEWVQAQETAAEQTKPARIIVFSDSQDCDRINKVPKPFGAKNYIVDVSAHKHGVNYQGVWTAEISGWSSAFIEYIAQYEDLGQQFAAW